MFRPNRRILSQSQAMAYTTNQPLRKKTKSPAELNLATNTSLDTAVIRHQTHPTLPNRARQPVLGSARLQNPAKHDDLGLAAY